MVTGLVSVGFQPRSKVSWFLSHELPRDSEPRSVRCGPLMEARVWLFTPLSRRTAVSSAGEEPRQTHAWGRSVGGAGESGHPCPGSITALLRPPWPGSRWSPPLNLALHVGSAGTRSGESAFHGQNLWSAVPRGRRTLPRWTPAMQALSPLRPYAAVLRLCTLVCCLWGGSPVRGVLHTAAA